MPDLDDNLISNIVPSLVLVEDNAMSVSISYFEEIKSAICWMDPCRFPKLDGYTSRLLDCLGHCGEGD